MLLNAAKQKIDQLKEKSVTLCSKTEYGRCWRIIENHDIIGGVIFGGQYGREVISRSHICTEMKALGTRVGIKKENYLRTTCATCLPSGTLKKQTISLPWRDVLGHTSIDTTRIYTRTTNAERKAKIEAVDL